MTINPMAVLDQDNDVVFDFKLSDDSSDFVLFDGKAKDLAFEDIKYGDVQTDSLKISHSQRDHSSLWLASMLDEFFTQALPPSSIQANGRQLETETLNPFPADGLIIGTNNLITLKQKLSSRKI